MTVQFYMLGSLLNSLKLFIGILPFSEEKKKNIGNASKTTILIFLSVLFSYMSAKLLDSITVT